MTYSENTSIFCMCEKWRKSLRMQRRHEEKRKMESFMSWPNCCLCRQRSHLSWTKRPSSDWPAATWGSESHSKLNAFNFIQFILKHFIFLNGCWTTKQTSKNKIINWVCFDEMKWLRLNVRENHVQIPR